VVSALILAALAAQAPAAPIAAGVQPRMTSLVCRGIGFDNEDMSVAVRVGSSENRSFAARFDGVRRSPGAHVATQFKIDRFEPHTSESAGSFVFETYLFRAGDNTYRLRLTRFLSDDRVIGEFRLAPGSFDTFRGYMASGTCREASQAEARRLGLSDAAQEDALAPREAVERGQLGGGAAPAGWTWRCEVVDREGRRHSATIDFGEGRNPSARLTVAIGGRPLNLASADSMLLTYRYPGGQMTTYSNFTDPSTGRNVELIGLPRIGWLALIPSPLRNGGRVGPADPLNGRCAYVPAPAAGNSQ
jgi:hypothetical protein